MCIILQFCDDNACQILCLIMVYMAFESAIFCKKTTMNYFLSDCARAGLRLGEGQLLAGINARLILALGHCPTSPMCSAASDCPPTGSSAVFCLLPTISVWWNGRVKASWQQQQPETQHVVLFSLVLLPMSLMWLSDPAIRWR
jgi:hypothetical protein